jgi:hypothetical protein
LHDVGVDDRHVRYCADATTAITLASDHGHVALVGRAAAASALEHRHVRSLALRELKGWQIRLDAVHRTGEKNDPAIRMIAAAVATH